MNEGLNKAEFQKMERKAIQNAKEMQEKSKTVTGKEMQKPAIHTVKEEKTKGALNEIAKPFTSFLGIKEDSSLILPLLLLLGKEGADDTLLLALMYILSF